MNYLTIILLMMILNCAAFGQVFWQQTNGPEGGNSYQIAKAPNGDLYSAAGQNGIYKSTNNGVTWLKLSWNETSLDFIQCYYIFVANNGYIYASGGGVLSGGVQQWNQAIFRSIDNGSTWTKVATTGPTRVRNFTETSNGYIFASRYYDSNSGERGGVYRSTNNGANWNLSLLSDPGISGISYVSADNNGNVYATEREFSQYKFWKSTDYGVNWTSSTNFQADIVLVKKSNSYVFASKSTGVYLSTNSGVTFTNISSASFSGCDKIWIDSEENVYASLSNQLYKSTNNGTTWQNLSFSFPMGLNDLLPLPGNLFYAAVDNNFVLITTNNGNNWIKSESGVFNSNITGLSTSRTGHIYALREGLGLYKSTNNGESWQTVNTPTTSLSLVCTDSSNNVFIGTGSVLYRSTDEGINWIQSGAGLPSADIRILTTGNDKNLYLQTSDTANGMYRSSNNGTTWSSIGLPYKITAIAVNSAGHIYAAQNLINNPSQQFNHNLYLSTNNGTNWNLVRNATGNITAIAVNQLTGNVFISVTSTGYFRSTNNGTNWFNINNGINNLTYSGIYTSSNGNVYCIGYRPGMHDIGSDFYSSTNEGNTWLPIRSGWISTNTFTRAVTVGANGFLYASAYRFNIETEGNAGVWRSITSSNTFSITGQVKYLDNGQPVTSGYIKAIKSINGEEYTLDSAVILSDGSYNLTKVPQDSVDLIAFQNDEDDAYFVPTFYQSTVYWQQSTTLFVNNNMSNLNINVIRNSNSTPVTGKITGNISRSIYDNSAIKNARIYARSSGVFRSYAISLSNGSYSIDSLPNGSYEIICDMVGYYGQTQNVVFNGGTLSNIDFNLAGYLVPIQIHSGSIPKKYRLYPNYPNPFNPITVIKFDIPERTMVSLRIYDIIGKEIAVLKREILSSGSYNVEWNASAYSSGVYFYRLVTDKYIQTHKMVLLK